MKKKEKNSFDTTVEMFKDKGADCLFLSHFEQGMVCGEACNSKTGSAWAISMVSSIEEALECKYKLACRSDDKKLVKYLEKHRKPTKEKEVEEMSDNICPDCKQLTGGNCGKHYCEKLTSGDCGKHNLIIKENIVPLQIGKLLGTINGANIYETPPSQEKVWLKINEIIDYLTKEKEGNG